MTIIWSVLIASAISYILTSMDGAPFNMNLTFIVAGMLSLTVFILGEGVLKTKES